MRRRNSPPRLEDVARHAGVHASTVSRFLNNPAVVSAATSSRIRAAIAALDYIPNLVAGSLASDRHRLIALLISDLVYPNFNEAIEAIASGLGAAGVNVMLCITGGSTERAEQLITRMLSWRVDAVVAWAPVATRAEKLLRRSGVTVVQISDASLRPVDVGIGFVQAELGAALARFVFERGYRRPHFVATMGHHSELRRDAFLAQWRKLTKQSKASVQLIDTPASFQHARRVFAQLRQLPVAPDVVLCPSDYLAQGVIVEARACGYLVPKDLAVVGLGNSPVAASMRPTITTVDIHNSRIAPEVLRVLETRSRGQSVARGHINLGFSLIARDSA